MEYEVKTYSADGVVYVRFAHEKPTFGVKYWDVKVTRVFESRDDLFTVAVSPADDYTSGVNVDRSEPRRPARMTGNAAAAWREKVAYIGLMESRYPLYQGRLRVLPDGSQELNMPQLAGKSLSFAVAVQGAVGVAVAAMRRSA